MTAMQAPLRDEETGRGDDAGHFAQLAAVLALVEKMAADEAPCDLLPEAGAIADAYRRAPAVARRRFDALSREASAIATAGVEALIASDGAPEAAAWLAAELRRAIERLARLVG